MTDEKRKQMMKDYFEKFGKALPDVITMEELERQWEEFKDEKSDLTVEDYEKVFDAIVKISMDCDGFGLFHMIRDEDVQKAKWIYAMLECLNDVPKSRVKHIAKYEELDMDVELNKLLGVEDEK